MVEGRIGLGATSGGSAGKGGSTATPRLSGLVPPRPMACVSGLSPGACAFSSGSSNCSGCTPAVQTDRWIQHIPYMIIIHLPAGWHLPDGGLSDCMLTWLFWAEGRDLLSRRPHVATLMFIWLALGMFLTCCLNIFLCRRNFDCLVIIGFKNFIWKPGKKMWCQRIKFCKCWILIKLSSSLIRANISHLDKIYFYCIK